MDGFLGTIIRQQSSLIHTHITKVAYQESAVARVHNREESV